MSFELLPQETKFHIFTYLREQNLIQFSMINKFYRKVIKHSFGSTIDLFKIRYLRAKVSYFKHDKKVSELLQEIKLLK